MTRWVFIGSSPSAPQQVDRLLPTLRPCKTITTNAGLKLLPNPDVYFCSDRVACQRYHDMARKAKEGGTHLVTMHRFQQALEERRVEWYDEFIINGVDPPTPQRWGCFNQSGPFSMEYACRQGATELHLLGCEGYSDKQSYFDQHERGDEHTAPAFRHKIADSKTLPQLIKRLTFVVQCFRHVPFYVHGQPTYTVDSPNWHVYSV